MYMNLNAVFYDYTTGESFTITYLKKKLECCLPSVLLSSGILVEVSKVTTFIFNYDTHILRIAFLTEQ